MKQFFIRYGIFCILSIMSIGLYLITNNFSIHIKQPIQLVLAEYNYKAYISHTIYFTPHKNDSLTINQTVYGNFTFIIDSVYKEPSFMVLLLHPENKNSFTQCINGESFIKGYIYIGKENIQELIVRKLKD